MLLVKSCQCLFNVRFNAWKKLDQRLAVCSVLSSEDFIFLRDGATPHLADEVAWGVSPIDEDLDDIGTSNVDKS